MSKKLEIDFEELKFAFEQFDTLGVPIRNFLDTETGEIIALCEDWEDYEEVCARLDTGLGERYREIDTLEPHDDFRIMEDFAHSVSKQAVKSRLLDALSRNKPFRRFKDIVHSGESLRDEWHAFHDDALAQYARNWLEALGIEAEFKKLE